MIHKDKLWIKFKELDIVCICDYNNRRCPLEKREDCHLYLAKFIRLGIEEAEDAVKAAQKSQSRLEKAFRQEQKKFESKVKRSIKKFKI